jgi:hypothetical protein
MRSFAVAACAITCCKAFKSLGITLFKEQYKAEARNRRPDAAGVWNVR